MVSLPAPVCLVMGIVLALLWDHPAAADTIVEVVAEGLHEPFGTEFDRRGTMYIVEMAAGNRLLRVDDDETLVRIAGQREAGFSGDGGPALQAQFNGPHNLAVLPDGNVLIADTWNGLIRKYDAKNGTIDSLAGFRVSLDQARRSGPYCISLDFAGGALFVANLNQIHRIDLESGVAKVVAGNGTRGRPNEAALAVQASLSDPRAVAVDRKGTMYILERGGNALRMVDTQGRIRTVVNVSGKRGGDGDGGPALDATLNGPKHLCIDKNDQVIIADSENHLIRRYVPETGIIERVAGTGKQGSAGIGGDPRACELSRPHGVTVHPLTGELYITDSYNDRVLKIVETPTTSVGSQ